MRHVLARAVLGLVVANLCGCPSDAGDAETDEGSTAATETSSTGQTTTSTTSSTSTDTLSTSDVTTTATATTTAGPSTTESSSSGDIDTDTATTTDASGSSSTSGVAMCDPDPSEPNNNEASATELPDLTDGDDPVVLTGVLDGETDVDWFKFHVADEALAFVVPLRELDRDGPVRMCKFYRCDADPGDTSVTCDGTEEDVLADGTPGCCTETGDIELEIDCVGGDDSGIVTIRLEPQADQCIAYSLTYGA